MIHRGDTKKSQRLRRAKKTRFKLSQLKAVRLSVHRTTKHIYAQVIDSLGKVLASASSLDKELKAADLSGKGKTGMAEKVGELVAKRAKDAGVSSVGFDRSGFKYHGRVKALADAVREAGLKC